MSFLTYLLILLGSYSGIIFGSILAIIAKEEMKNGRKYLSYLQMSLFALIVLILLMFFDVNELISVIIVVLLIILELYLYGYLRSLKNINMMLYLIYGIFAYFLSLNPTFNILFPSLIFLYGFPTGSLLTEKISDIKKNALIYSSYIILGIVMYVIYNFK